MKKLAIAAALSLSLSTASPGDLGATQTAPSYKPATVEIVFLTALAVAAFGPALLLGKVVMAAAGVSVAAAVETTK